MSPRPFSDAWRGWLHAGQRQTRAFFAPQDLRSRIMRGAVVFAMAAAFYWLLIASDRYVSEAHVVIQRTDGMATSGTALLGLVQPSAGREDQLLLRDHLLSTDMLLKLDARLDLRTHYSDWRRDPLSRLWFESTPLEKFHAHYLDRVTVEFDEFSGVLVIRAQAYDAETARAIAAALVEEGERHMNAMAHALAAEQVDFLEQQVAELNKRAMNARRVVLDFQDRNGIASPERTALSLEEIIGGLEARHAELQARRGTLLAYLMPDSPSVREVEQQIAAVAEQIGREHARLASPDGTTLNRTVEEFQRLELEAGFAQELYKSALAALEQGRIEAVRTLKKVSVLQTPALPEYATEPRRLYNTLVFALVTLLLAGVLNLTIIIIRDHRD